MSTRLSLMVTTDDPQIIIKVAEQMSRTAVGLALDGVDTAIFIGPEEMYDDEH